MFRGSACGPNDWVFATGGFGRGFGGHRHGRGGRPWWAEAMGEPPPARAERGGVRYLVLEAIEAQPRHGYEIIQHIEQRAGGAYRPSPGVIYPTLQMLEELEHARLVERDGRKSYAITDAGKVDLDANRSQVADFYARFGEESWDSYAEDFTELMKFVGHLVRTVKLGMHRGRMSPATMRAIRLALEDALKRVDEALNGSGR